MSDDEEAIRERLEGQRITEYRNHEADGYEDVVLEDGTVIYIDGLWWPAEDDDE